MAWVGTQRGRLVLRLEDRSHNRWTQLSQVSGDILSIRDVWQVGLALPCVAIVSILFLAKERVSHIQFG